MGSAYQESDRPALCLGGEGVLGREVGVDQKSDDILDRADRLTQRCKDAVAFEGLSLSERYIEGGLFACFDFGIGEMTRCKSDFLDCKYRRLLVAQVSDFSTWPHKLNGAEFIDDLTNGIDRNFGHAFGKDQQPMLIARIEGMDAHNIGFPPGYGSSRRIVSATFSPANFT
jgi:hypothetical protein